MKPNQRLILVLSCLIFAACSNTQTGGIGLHSAPPKPTPQQEITAQSKKIVDVYNSLTYLPGRGFEKLSEYLRQVPNTDCIYKITEKMILVETDPEIITQIKNDQVLEAGPDFCPPKDPFFVDSMTTKKFRDFANDRIAQFFKFSDIKTFFLHRFSWRFYNVFFF